MPSIDELAKILNECGVKLTFDPYRDNTKGCGPDCHGWDSDSRNWCANHLAAILRGDFLVKGGMVAGEILRLRMELERHVAFQARTGVE